MQTEELVGAAIPAYKCPVCCKDESSNEIIINKRLTKSMAKKVNDMHNKPIGWLEKPCKECKTQIEEMQWEHPGIWFVGMDPEKSELLPNGNIKEPSSAHRTGDNVAMAADMVMANFSMDKEQADVLAKTGWLFCDYRVINQIKQHISDGMEEEHNESD